MVDYLDFLCSYALVVGMSYDDYWYSDPKLLLVYTRAEEIRQRKKSRELWLQGLYVYEAIGCLVPILNPFSKDHKAKKYMSEPFPVSEKELEERRLARISKWTNMMMSKVKKG